MLLLLSIASALCYATAFHQPCSQRLGTRLQSSMLFNFGGSTPKTKNNKKVVVITGTTSGLGKETMRDLLSRDDYYVVAACRDTEKMKRVAETEGFDKQKYDILPLDLGSFDSTRAFVKTLKNKYPKPLDALVCNAAVYQPANLKDSGAPRFTADGFEEQLQINHLSHFLLCNLLLSDMSKAKDARMIVVGSITGNDNTVGGGLVWPQADLGKLDGLKDGGKKPIAMIDGKPFNGAKAYKDSKVCNMMTINELHKRYHLSTGITFSTMYPGCIAESQLFREKRQWFRDLFPVFMKYVTGGYVSQPEAGQRLAQCVYDERCKKSGVYWSWNGGAKTVGYLDGSDGKVFVRGAGGAGGELFENSPSAKVQDEKRSQLMWDYSSEICGVTWPVPKVTAASNFAKI